MAAPAPRTRSTSRRLATANFTLTRSATHRHGEPARGRRLRNIGSLVGNDTTSTLTGRDVASTWTVTGSNAGSVNDGSGTTNFTGVTSLVGGSAADAFVLGAGFAVASINGGAGSNSLTATAQATEDITLGNALLTGRSPPTSPWRTSARPPSSAAPATTS